MSGLRLLDPTVRHLDMHSNCQGLQQKVKKKVWRLNLWNRSHVFDLSYTHFSCSCVTFNACKSYKWYTPKQGWDKKSNRYASFITNFYFFYCVIKFKVARPILLKTQINATMYLATSRMRHTWFLLNLVEFLFLTNILGLTLSHWLKSVYCL